MEFPNLKILLRQAVVAGGVLCVDATQSTMRLTTPICLPFRLSRFGSPIASQHELPLFVPGPLLCGKRSTMSCPSVAFGTAAG